MNRLRAHGAWLTGLIVSVLLLVACSGAPKPGGPASPRGPESFGSGRPWPGGTPGKEFQRGMASWYGPGFHGRRTASGESYDMHALTAAHPSLPFGTRVRVRSLKNGKEVDVRITDRGPFGKGRIIDLSRAAADALGMLGVGVHEVALLVPD